MKGFTVGELKKILDKYQDDLVITILHDGKGHHHLIYEEDVQVKDNCYFPEYGLEQDSEEFKYLQIGVI